MPFGEGCRLRLRSGNYEVNCDLGQCLDWLSVLQVGLEVPLANSFAGFVSVLAGLAGFGAPACLTGLVSLVGSLVALAGAAVDAVGADEESASGRAVFPKSASAAGVSLAGNQRCQSFATITTTAVRSNRIANHILRRCWVSRAVLRRVPLVCNVGRCSCISSPFSRNCVS